MSDDKELPNVIHIVAKPLLERLKQWLAEHRYTYVNSRTGDGGCDTCGYGAEVFHELDPDALDREIDAFGESLRNEKRS